MAHVQDEIGKRAELRLRAMELGKKMALAAYGDDGPGLDVDLTAIEDLAGELSQALVAGVCEEAARRQAQRIGPVHACPGCGRECAVETPSEARPIQTRHGPFQWPEPQCYCPQCRRAFFPSADRAQDGPPRL